MYNLVLWNRFLKKKKNTFHELWYGKNLDLDTFFTTQWVMQMPSTSTTALFSVGVDGRPSMLSKSKFQCVVCFDQLLGAAFVDFSLKSLKKVWNEQKRLKTAEKVVRPAFGCAQHPKAGRNTQHQRFHHAPWKRVFLHWCILKFCFVADTKLFNYTISGCSRIRLKQALSKSKPKWLKF